MTTIEIQAQPLSPNAFEPYGQAIIPLPGQKPDFSGVGWQCWFPLAELYPGIYWQAGMVRSEPRPLEICEMERHLERPECVFALDKPIIQTVAFSRPDNPDIPDEQSMKAFILQPGQGVLVNNGIWHGVGLPAGPESVVYLFLLGRGELYLEEEISGWVSFDGEVKVKIILQ